MTPEEAFPKSGITDWELSNWYKEWVKLARKDYQGNQGDGYWISYINKKGKLKDRYIKIINGFH